MPRSDAVPVDQSATPTGRSAAVPLDQPATTTAAAPSIPLFSLTGPDKIGEFFSKAGDTATFGLGAKLQDALGIGQKDGQTVAQQVEAAGKDIGPYASTGADLLGYVAGPGTLGVGAGLGKLATSGLARGVGENAISRVGGRMIGSGIEGAGATILGNAGHDQETTTGDLIKSAALGAATGVLPGGREPQPKTPSTADLLQAKDAKFAPLKTTPANAPAVDAAINGVGSRSGARVSLSDTFKAKVADIEKEVTGTKSGLTAEDVADYQRELWSKTRNGFDKAAAGNYERALDNAVGPSTAYDIKAANAAHNTYKTSGEMDKWLTNPGEAPKAIASRLAKKPAFYQNQPGLFDALSTIGKQADSPLWKQVRDYAVRGAVGGGIGYGTSALLGGNPGQSTIEGALAGVVAPHAIKAAGSIPIKNALLAAKHLNATGMKVDPGVYTPKWLQIPGMLARQGGYAAGASGEF